MVSLRGQVSGDLLVQTLSGVYLDLPEVTHLDMLFDLTDYEGTVQPTGLRNSQEQHWARDSAEP